MDALAKLRAQSSSHFVVFCNPPPMVENLLTFDKTSMFCNRLINSQFNNLSQITPKKKKKLGQKKKKKKRIWTTVCCEGKMRKLQVGEAKISQKSDKDLWAKVTGGVGEKVMNEGSRRRHYGKRQLRALFPHTFSSQFERKKFVGLGEKIFSRVFHPQSGAEGGGVQGGTCPSWPSQNFSSSALMVQNVVKVPT